MNAFSSDGATELEDERATHLGPEDGDEHEPAPPPVPFRSDIRRVVIRLQGGEEIEAGTAIGREAAVVIARELVAAIEYSASSGEWPEIGERFLRPGAIISIDVQRAA